MKNTKFKGMKKATVFALALSCMVTMFGTAAAPAAVHAEETETATAEGGRTVPFYSLVKDGGNWDGSHYTKADGTLATDVFFFDGTYTYYLQADGSPMKDKLTYHPDGEHIIYLDTEGHEVFTSFQYCPSVEYTCYFDSQGYLYKDQITFVGDKVYYLNANGKMEQNGWFGFANGRDYGFANQDGTLITTGWGYDPYGRTVFYHWNGMVARGLISDASYYYNMDETDGHYIGQWAYNSIVVDGYAFDVDKMNAVSAQVKATDAFGSVRDGFEYGNTVCNGIDYAAVFNAQAYLKSHSSVRNAGFTTENAILQFVNDGMPAGTVGDAFAARAYCANYYDELYPKYGKNWKLYYYDYMCYGYNAGKVADRVISEKAQLLNAYDFDYAAMVRDYPEYR